MSSTVVITGAASGIGAALAQSHLAGGDNVVATDIDAAGLQRLPDQLSGSGALQTVELDVRDAAAVQQMVDNTVSERGGVDVMYNNAGIGVGGRTHELDPQHWDRVIDVNLKGVIHGVHAVLPSMLERGRGHIVNTASLAGLLPSPGLAPYVATKHAVVGLTLSLRAEYAHQGVQFTVLCPGFTDTPLLDKGLPEDLPQVDLPVEVRAMAESLPGGVYELDALVRDIRKGVTRNEAMVVAPAAARVAWRSFRLAPNKFLALLIRQVKSSQ
jgi:NAD(P)-dependent dehydrogenase (short-subunit alcohol dehydrogenase family)